MEPREEQQARKGSDRDHKGSGARQLTHEPDAPVRPQIPIQRAWLREPVKDAVANPGGGPADLGAGRQRRLTDRERLILLHFYLDLPLDEIGKVPGLSKQGVKSRMYRATRSMRPALRCQKEV